MLRIWGRTNSINVQKVLWCCAELAIPYERIDAGLQFGVVTTPAYLALNPNALIPTIEDAGFVVFIAKAVEHGPRYSVIALRGLIFSRKNCVGSQERAHSRDAMGVSRASPQIQCPFRLFQALLLAFT